MDKIKTIAHLADIHIRKLHRFVEYRDVIEKTHQRSPLILNISDIIKLVNDKNI